MADTDGNGSRAAQGAPFDPETEQARGFFARLRDTLTPGGPDPDPKLRAALASAQAQPMLGMLNLRRMRVGDVMIPKADIVAVPVDIAKVDLVEAFRSSGLTRLPAYDGTLDTPIGFANLKDFALRYGFNGTGPDMDLRAMLRPLLFVPPSMPLGILLQKMQADRTHMALVIDEYGGTDGLVTIEDLLEQVVGAIEDEHDQEEVKSFVAQEDGSYLAKAKTSLEDFEAEIGLDLTAHEDIDEEEVDTLGGLVFMLAGHVPVRGEVIPHPEGVEFEVLEADPRRVKRLRVRLPKPRNG